MLMPMIHYNASTIRGRDRSIHITTVICGRGCGRTIDTTTTKKTYFKRRVAVNENDDARP